MGVGVNMLVFWGLGKKKMWGKTELFRMNPNCYIVEHMQSHSQTISFFLLRCAVFGQCVIRHY
jgi:hypothetical protein